MTYLEIAKELIVAEATAKTHIANIYSKLDCHSHLELMRKRIEELENEVSRVQSEVAYWRSFVRKD